VEQLALHTGRPTISVTLVEASLTALARYREADDETRPASAGAVPWAVSSAIEEDDMA